MTTHEPVDIIGAGMAGLFAGKFFSQRNHPVVIYEAQPSLPNNHSAILRFRTPNVGNVLGLPFKKVTVLKSYEPWANPIADTFSYSRKCTGTARSDRSIVSTGMSTNERYIAPPNLIDCMAYGQQIECGVHFSVASEPCYSGRTIISTIPMPALMDTLSYPRKPEFLYVHGFNLRFRVHCAEAYASLYIPSPKYAFNRISITGDMVVAEYSFPTKSRKEVETLMQRISMYAEVNKVLSFLGFEAAESLEVIDGAPELRMQPYSKIMPMDENIRRDFIHWASDSYNIYSLGRYATWRPGLLLDDLVQDCDTIDRMIGNRYLTAQLRAKA